MAMQRLQRLAPAPFQQGSTRMFQTVSRTHRSSNLNSVVWASCFSSLKAGQEDNFERYRRTRPSKDLWKELRAETEHTLQCIDQNIKEKIVLEIQNAAKCLQDPTPEFGPTGQYLYKTVDDDKGNRTYIRRNIASEQEQTILELSLQEFQLHAMSLSVDERYLAFLVSRLEAPSEHSQVRLKDMDSAKEVVLPLGSQNVCNVECGAVKPNGSHGLFFTTTNSLGRPYKVHVCCVDNGMAVSEMRQIYHCDDEALGRSFGRRQDVARDEYAVVDMDLFRDFVALYERSVVDGRQRIRITSRRVQGMNHVVPIPFFHQKCPFLSPGGNMRYHATSIRFRMESPCTPPRTYNYDLVTGTLDCVSSQSEKAFGDQYIEKRLLVTSLDGTHVPLSLLYKKGEVPVPGPNHRRPAVLIGYGAYGEPVMTGFDPLIIPLLDRGFIVAYAHTRGGGDLGRAWYRAGRLYEKMRSIDDYLACAEALVDVLAVTEAKTLVAKGFSAGGVTVAGAVNKKPSLFAGVVLTNPFLDVTSAANEKSSPLTQHEWEEWGNPQVDEVAAEAISSYCPFSNVSHQPYPKMLLVASLDDVNVPYWHAVTFAMKVRRALSEEMERSSVLLQIETTGGHQLHGRRLDVAALEAAFILSVCKSDK